MKRIYRGKTINDCTELKIMDEQGCKMQERMVHMSHEYNDMLITLVVTLPYWLVVFLPLRRC